MFEAYKKNRALNQLKKDLQKQQKAAEFHVEQAKAQQLERSMHRRQMTCQHEFGEIQGYAWGGFDETKHFVVCKKCALRREV